MHIYVYKYMYIHIYLYIHIYINTYQTDETRWTHDPKTVVAVHVCDEARHICQTKPYMSKEPYKRDLHSTKETYFQDRCVIPGR